MKIKQLKFNWKDNQKGQAFVELILVFLVLMALLVGMVEFGNLLNQYINLVDAAREGARFMSNDDPLQSRFVKPDGTVEVGYPAFYDKVYDIVQGNYDPISNPSGKKGALNPIVLDSDVDDIVVSVYSVTGGPLVSDREIKLLGQDAKWGNNNPISNFTLAQIGSMVDGTAPNSGILLVEIFYNYNQILKFYQVVGDPILVHAYSIMPLTSAEPTPTPKPP